MALKFFELGNHVLGFMTTSRLDEKHLDEIECEITKLLEKYEVISIYCENASNEGMTGKAAFTHLLFKLKFKDRFDKIAIVSDVFKDKLWSKVERTFVNSDCHYYKCAERQEALQWIAC